MGRLQRCDPNEHSAERLFPLMINHLYMGSSEKSGEEIGEAVIASIEEYLDRMSSQSVRTRMKDALRNFLEGYLLAISWEFTGDAGQEALNEAQAYCASHWSEIAPA